MKRIKTFNQLFEATKMHEDCEEFFDILNGTRELEQIKKWYDLAQVRTGRINVKVIKNNPNGYINLPGSPFFHKARSDRWMFTFVSSGKFYGMKDSSDLVTLAKTFIKDIIYKSAPVDFNRAEANKMLDDENFIFSKIWKTPSEPYIEYRSNKGNEIITNLSFVEKKSNLLGTLGKISKVYVKGDENLNSLYIDLSNVVDLIPDELKDALGVHRYDIEMDAAEIDIIPKGIGTKTISNSKVSRGPSREIRKVKITIGYKTEEEVVKAVDDIIKKYAKSIIVYIKNRNGGPSDMIESELLTSIVRSLLGGDLSDNEDSMSVIDNYFKKNPLELYVLNNNPKLKAEVIKRTGIKDYSRLGMGLKNGLL